MNMLLLVLIVATFFLAYSFFASRLKPQTGASKKRSIEAYNDYTKFQKKKKNAERKEWVMSQLDKFSKLQLSDFKRDRLNTLIDRLNIEELTPERIVSEQVYSVLLYSFIAILISTLVFLKPLNIYGAFLIELFALLSYKIKLKEYESKVKEKDDHIMDELFSFYSVLCSTYQKSYDTPLDEIVNNFIKSTNPDMREELTVLLVNIRTMGAVRALMVMKHRVNLPYVLRVCDTLITRFSTATDNTSTMLYLKEELKKLRYDKLDVVLAKKKAKVAKAQLIVVLVLIVYAVLHFYFQSFSSFAQLFGG